jgi:membrane protein implicated in regulation of membrane protease activity
MKAQRRGDVPAGRHSGGDARTEVEMTVPAVLGAAPGLAAVDLAGWLATIAMVVLLPVVAMVVGQLWRAWRSPTRTGADGLIGRKVVVRSANGLTGRVRLDGAFWGVRSAGAPLAVGQPVRVLAVDGLELVVEPVPGRPPSELVAALRVRLH